MDKAEIRQLILQKRDSLTDDEIAKSSRTIFEKLTNRDEYINADNILIYSSFGSEVRTDEIIPHSLAMGKKVFCPKVTDKKNGQMKFVRIYSLEDLKEGFHSIREPELMDTSEVFGATREFEFTLVVMPGVAFDKNRGRLGYNGGFYDRFLAANPDFSTIAIAHDVQVYDGELPQEETDIKPDIVLTESELY